MPLSTQRQIFTLEQTQISELGQYHVGYFYSVKDFEGLSGVSSFTARELVGN